MKNKILCLTMMLLTIMCSCGQQSAKKEHTNGKDSITISYQLLKNDSPMVKEYTSQEPQYAFNVTLQGNIKDTPYKLNQIHVKEGNVQRTEIVQEKPCTADSIQHFFFASIMEGKENVRIICNHQEKNELQITIPAYQYILMETYPSIKQTKDEILPLIAFTKGKFNIFEIDGIKYEGLDYCGVDLLKDKNGQPIVCEVNSNAFISNLLANLSLCTGFSS